MTKKYACLNENTKGKFVRFNQLQKKQGLAINWKDRFTLFLGCKEHNFDILMTKSLNLHFATLAKI